MATTRSFQDMLNEYLPTSLLKDEVVQRDYVLSKIEKDNGWKGGTYVVPFKGAGASTVTYGSLAASNDIGEDVYVRGTVSTRKEVWGSMIFNQRDLMEHDGSVKEKSFLKILPGAVEDFTQMLKNTVSTNILNGAHIAKATADGTVGGAITVDRPERLMIGQKVIVDDDNSSPATGYIRTIDMNTGVLAIYDARSGGSVVDLSGYTTAQNAKLYNDGAQSNSFNSIRGALLSAANGGDSTLHGQTKTAYPFLQAINVSYSTVSGATKLAKIFNAFVDVRKKSKGNPTECWMSYTNFGEVLANLESSKGAYNVRPGSEKTSAYGWTEIEIGGPKGALKIVAIQELDNDVIMFMDWSAIKFASNGFIQKRTAPDGKQYYEVRNTTGYQYILDMCLFGELIVEKPHKCGILHTVT
jgi:hypothetical protein